MNKDFKQGEERARVQSDLKITEAAPEVVVRAEESPPESEAEPPVDESELSSCCSGAEGEQSARSETERGAANLAVPDGSSQADGRKAYLRPKLSDSELVLRYKSRRTISYAVAVVFIASLMCGPLMLCLSLAWGPIKYAGSIGLACLGEKDWAYALTTSYPQLESGDGFEVVSNRSDIIDKFMGEQKTSNGESIFSALGAEAMNLTYGDRARGLKYGDGLIARYPDLPSNYFWRAQIDYENGKFAQAAEHADQFVSLVSRISAKSRQSWLDDCSIAVWSNLYAGQEDKAFEALVEYQKLIDDSNSKNDRKKTYFTLTEVASLSVPVYLQMYDSLAPEEMKKTDLWTAQADKAAQRWLATADDGVKKIGYNSPYSLYYAKQRLSRLITGLRGGRPRPISPSSLSYDSSGVSYYELSLLAQDALVRGDYDKAGALIEMIPERFRYCDEMLCLAKVFIKQGRFVDAIEAVDPELNSSENFRVMGQFYLQSSLIKAQAYYGLKEYSKAIALCDKVLGSNPHMLNAYLIKMKCYDAQGSVKESAAERERLKTALVSLLSQGER